MVTPLRSNNLQYNSSAVRFHRPLFAVTDSSLATSEETITGSTAALTNNSSSNAGPSCTTPDSNSENKSGSDFRVEEVMDDRFASVTPPAHNRNAAVSKGSDKKPTLGSVDRYRPSLGERNSSVAKPSPSTKKTPSKFSNSATKLSSSSALFSTGLRGAGGVAAKASTPAASTPAASAEPSLNEATAAAAAATANSIMDEIRKNEVSPTPPKLSLGTPSYKRRALTMTPVAAVDRDSSVAAIEKTAIQSGKTSAAAVPQDSSAPKNTPTTTYSRPNYRRAATLLSQTSSTTASSTAASSTTASATAASSTTASATAASATTASSNTASKILSTHSSKRKIVLNNSKTAIPSNRSSHPLYLNEEKKEEDMESLETTTVVAKTTPMGGGAESTEETANIKPAPLVASSGIRLRYGRSAGAFLKKKKPTSPSTTTVPGETVTAATLEPVAVDPAPTSNEILDDKVEVSKTPTASKVSQQQETSPRHEVSKFLTASQQHMSAPFSKETFNDKLELSKVHKVPNVSQHHEPPQRQEYERKKWQSPDVEEKKVAEDKYNLVCLSPVTGPTNDSSGIYSADVPDKTTSAPEPLTRTPIAPIKKSSWITPPLLKPTTIVDEKIHAVSSEKEQEEGLNVERPNVVGPNKEGPNEEGPVAHSIVPTGSIATSSGKWWSWSKSNSSDNAISTTSNHSADSGNLQKDQEAEIQICQNPPNTPTNRKQVSASEATSSLNDQQYARSSAVHELRQRAPGDVGNVNQLQQPPPVDLTQRSSVAATNHGNVLQSWRKKMQKSDDSQKDDCLDGIAKANQGHHPEEQLEKTTMSPPPPPNSLASIATSAVATETARFSSGILQSWRNRSSQAEVVVAGSDERRSSFNMSLIQQPPVDNQQASFQRSGVSALEVKQQSYVGNKLNEEHGPKGNGNDWASFEIKKSESVLSVSSQSEGKPSIGSFLNKAKESINPNVVDAKQQVPWKHQTLKTEVSNPPPPDSSNMPINSVINGLRSTSKGSSSKQSQDPSSCEVHLQSDPYAKPVDNATSRNESVLASWRNRGKQTGSQQAEFAIPESKGIHEREIDFISPEKSAPSAESSVQGSVLASWKNRIRSDRTNVDGSEGPKVQMPSAVKERHQFFEGAFSKGQSSLQITGSTDNPSAVNQEFRTKASNASQLGNVQSMKSSGPSWNTASTTRIHLQQESEQRLTQKETLKKPTSSVTLSPHTKLSGGTISDILPSQIKYSKPSQESDRAVSEHLPRDKSNEIVDEPAIVETEVLSVASRKNMFLQKINARSAPVLPDVAGAPISSSKTSALDKGAAITASDRGLITKSFQPNTIHGNDKGTPQLASPPVKGSIASRSNFASSEVAQRFGEWGKGLRPVGQAVKQFQQGGVNSHASRSESTGPESNFHDLDLATSSMRSDGSNYTSINSFGPIEEIPSEISSQLSSNEGSRPSHFKLTLSLIKSDNENRSRSLTDSSVARSNTFRSVADKGDTCVSERSVERSDAAMLGIPTSVGASGDSELGSRSFASSNVSVAARKAQLWEPTPSGELKLNVKRPTAASDTQEGMHSTDHGSQPERQASIPQLGNNMSQETIGSWGQRSADSLTVKLSESSFQEGRRCPGVPTPVGMDPLGRNHDVSTTCTAQKLTSDATLVSRKENISLETKSRDVDVITNGSSDSQSFLPSSDQSSKGRIATQTMNYLKSNSASSSNSTGSVCGSPALLQRNSAAADKRDRSTLVIVPSTHADLAATMKPPAHGDRSKFNGHFGNVEDSQEGRRTGVIVRGLQAKVLPEKDETGSIRSHLRSTSVGDFQENLSPSRIDHTVPNFPARASDNDNIERKEKLHAEQSAAPMLDIQQENCETLTPLKSDVNLEMLVHNQSDANFDTELHQDQDEQALIKSPAFPVDRKEHRPWLKDQRTLSPESWQKKRGFLFDSTADAGLLPLVNVSDTSMNEESFECPPLIQLEACCLSDKKEMKTAGTMASASGLERKIPFLLPPDCPKSSEQLQVSNAANENFSTEANIVFGDPAAFGAAGGEDESTPPAVSERAKALEKWKGGLGVPPRKVDKQDIIRKEIGRSLSPIRRSDSLTEEDRKFSNIGFGDDFSGEKCSNGRVLKADSTTSQGLWIGDNENSRLESRDTDYGVPNDYTIFDGSLAAMPASNTVTNSRPNDIDGWNSLEIIEFPTMNKVAMQNRKEKLSFDPFAGDDEDLFLPKIQPDTFAKEMNKAIFSLRDSSEDCSSSSENCLSSLPPQDPAPCEMAPVISFSTFVDVAESDSPVGDEQLVSPDPFGSTDPFSLDVIPSFNPAPGNPHVKIDNEDIFDPFGQDVFGNAAADQLFVNSDDFTFQVLAPASKNTISGMRPEERDDFFISKRNEGNGYDADQSNLHDSNFEI